MMLYLIYKSYFSFFFPVSQVSLKSNSLQVYSFQIFKVKITKLLFKKKKKS